MKRLFFAITLVAVCCLSMSAYATDSQSDSSSKPKAPERQGWGDPLNPLVPLVPLDPLYGDVESVVITTYELEDKFGEVVRVGITDDTKYYFNEAGDVIEKAYYNSDGSLRSKDIYKYDTSGNQIEKAYYNSDGSLEDKRIYIYDASGNEIEYAVYNSDGSLNWKSICKYDSSGNMIELAGYRSDGSLWDKHIYKYDTSGNQIELAIYKSDGSLSYKNISKYDTSGNQIEKACYNPDGSDGSLRSKDIYKYDTSGNMIEKAEYWPDGSLGYKYIFKYDTSGNMIEKAGCNYDGSLDSKSIWKYDALGNVIEKTVYNSEALLPKSQTVYEIGLAHQRASHLHHLESRIEHLVDTLAADQTTDIDQRALQLLAELHRVVVEEGLLEGVLLDHHRSKPTHEISQPQRHIVAHRVDRNQTAHNSHRRTAHKAARQHDTIDAIALDHLCDLDRLGNLDTALEAVLHIVLNEDRGARLCGCLHYLVHTHTHKAHTVVERAAELIAAVVGIGREELRNQIAVTCVHLDAVETRLVSRVNGATKVACHLTDLIFAHTAHGCVGIHIDTRRRTDRNLTCGRVVGHISTVTDLDRSGSASLVHSFGNIFQSGNDLGTQPQLFVERQTATTYGGVGQRSHTDTALCHANVVVLQLLRGTELITHRLESRRADRAVAQGDVAQLVGRKEL